MKRIHKDGIREVLQQKKQRRQEKLAAKKERYENSAWGKKVKKLANICNKISLILHFVLAFGINYIIEAISRHSPVKAWEYLMISPRAFLFNTYMIFATFFLVYIFRRRVFTRIIISVLWLVLGIVNGYMLSVRVTPFNAQDLKVVGDAVTMIDKYFSGVQGILIITGIVIAVIWLVSMWKRGAIYQGKMYRIPAAILAAAVLWSISPVTKLMVENRIVSDYFGNIAFAYEDYGLPYCFAASLFNTGIDKPSVYSEEVIKEIGQDGALLEKSYDSEVKPNIILIQLESFFDTNEVEFFTTSEDPIPTFRYIMDNYTNGYFKVPSVGAGTANTEFEVLTGMNLRYFGPGEYPYKTIIKYQETESVASVLKEFGYGAHALHNNGGNFYSRADVFNNMGFDSYTSKEFMNILQYTENGWAKDNVLTQHILNAMDSTDHQDFVFCITVEGHGDYPKEQVIENPRIKVEGIEDEGITNSWEYFVNHLYETDLFIKDLITELEERNEPTVLIMYGDHLPTLELEVSDLKNRYLYNTNYVIWDNIGLEEEDRNVPTYQLMSDVFEKLGIRSGIVFNYHQDKRETRDYLKNLELLQYDMLYGENYIYGGKEFAYARDEDDVFQMGILDAHIYDMRVNLDGTYSFYGDNLTANSKIYVNGEKQSTKFLNNTRIELRECELNEGDSIIVNQVGSSNRVFRSTEEYKFSDGKLVLASEYVAPVAEETTEEPM